MREAKENPREPEAKLKQNRLPREQRSQQIVAIAAQFFADRGFTAPTRELAQRLGVTQALLYRYFASKEALIVAVFDNWFADRWDPDWQQRLNNRIEPVGARLCSFYEGYLGRGDELSLRLFMRANLDGLGFARRYRFPLTERILQPVVEELRYELELPPLRERPLLDEERELALILHGGLVFSRIREHIYQSNMPQSLKQRIELHVMTFLPGALQRLGELHKQQPE